MADFVLKPLSPLGHTTAHITTIGPLTIAENTAVALASLASRLGQAGDVAGIAARLGLPLPVAGHCATGAVYSAFWLGPQQWMVEAPFVSHEDIVAQLKPQFGEAASITEQTDAWVRFDLAAPDLPPLFERLCNYDLRKHGPGCASRTVIEHLGCYLVHRAFGEITLLGPRSSARSLHHALMTAANSLY